MKQKLYHYTECGLDNVWLENGFQIHKTPHGEGVSFNHAEQLEQIIALGIISSASPLEPKEFRFLRNQLDMTQLEIAGLFGVDVQTIARWEKGENPINAAADRLMRLLYWEQRDKTVPVKDTLWRLTEDRAQKKAKLVWREERGHWKPVKTA